MNRRLYVYYRVAEADLARVADAVGRMHAALSGTHPGLHCELLRRPGHQDGQVTVMETYVASDGIDAALQSGIEASAAALALPLRGERHTEVFEPVR